MKILLLNNYSMRSALKGVRRGNYPSHHLYGHPGLERVSERNGNRWALPFFSIYDVIPFHGRFWQRLRGGIVRYVGDPIQQVHALFSCHRIDVVFAADQWSARSLLRLRRIGLFPAAIVVLVHHPPTSKGQVRDLRSADLRVALGPLAAHAMTVEANSATATLPWGPSIDGSLYKDLLRSNEICLDFVSAGKTNREYGPLIELAVKDRLSGIIYDGKYRVCITKGTVDRERVNADYPMILRDMAAAAVVAIPFARDDVMAGLTEVADAIALEKPILATQSLAFPYDLERFNAGVTVKNDVAQLRTGLHTLAETKANGRNLASVFNLANFEAALERVLVQAVYNSAESDNSA